ncbi:replication terminator protein [Enterococcus sp. BWM-S5]|uniref:Replication terminator protein n=1 Tax=Enterococcus larvae TaxID=2794352 RepID=A0ABS4CEF2_9ENTE|nr:replication terminator protein [Enterococcus larvae]MBP1044871.1 replication terminator protein [Enterococcus larvae]
MSKEIELDLVELANGAIQEKLDGELEKIFNNIHDPNTKAKDKRTVTIKLEFKPDDNRQVVNLNSSFTTALAPVRDFDTTILTGKDFSTGKVAARELKSEVPGQTFIDPTDGQPKTDVGEPIDVIEKEEAAKEAQQQQIINLQQKRG